MENEGQYPEQNLSDQIFIVVVVVVFRYHLHCSIWTDHRMINDHILFNLEGLNRLSYFFLYSCLSRDISLADKEAWSLKRNHSSNHWYQWINYLYRNSTTFLDVFDLIKLYVIKIVYVFHHQKWEDNELSCEK